MNRKSLLLNKTDIRSLLALSECIEIVENAFRLHAEGNILKPDLLHVDSDEGEFHIKAGGIKLDKIYFGLKSNSGFFQNKIKYGLPNIQGLILLFDGENGSPLAIFESGEITIQRTGAATAVAAKYLSRPDSEVVTICGCGRQGRIQLEALKLVRPIKQAYACDPDPAVRESFCEDMSGLLHIPVIPIDNLKEAAQESDICVTCTPARNYFFKKEYAKEGVFIAAVGADSPEKQEIEPSLMAECKVVADITDQCVVVGEVHHAIESGLMAARQIHAEIGEIIIGKKLGRTSNEEITIYDATGTALQDVAAALAVYKKAIRQNKGTWFDFPV